MSPSLPWKWGAAGGETLISLWDLLQPDGELQQLAWLDNKQQGKSQNLTYFFGSALSIKFLGQ